jgi:hypothetical protein
MFYIIENLDQLQSLKNLNYKEAYIEVIPYSPNLHPAENEISLIYLRPLNSHKGYILSVDHSETLCLNSEYIGELVKQYDTLYVWGKKEFLHFYLHKNIIDLSLLSPKYEIETTTSHKILERRYKNFNKINTIIPLVKHYEVCEKNYNNLKPYINEPTNKFYNNRVPLVFNSIERNGLRVDPLLFEDHFNKSNQNIIYTQYNYNTTTTRPSNRFGGINFAALNKEDGCRKSIIPKNNKFIELDISAYHPTLVSHLIDYQFNTSDIHQSFAEMYGVNYKKSKELTFKQLYGGVFKQYQHLEFFQKTKAYVDNLWNLFQNQGFIECPISEYKFQQNKLEEMNPQKLFNYLLQALETAQNVLILWDIIGILRGGKTELVLYTYDSFLLDYNEEDKNLLLQIQEVFKKYKLNIKEKQGINYHEMIPTKK